MSTEKAMGNRQTALVTGASGGIGQALAGCFARGGYDVVLVARSTEALEATAADLSTATGVKTNIFACDLSQHGAVDRLAGQMEERGLQVDVLVNNAGFGARGAFADVDPTDQINMIDLNIKALTALTLKYWPGMIERGRGGVLNVASLAGFQPGPYLSVYSASKAYVLSLSEALWQEARGTGVHVCCVAPGPTASSFHSRAGTENLPSPGGLMPAKSVAELAFEGFRNDKRIIVPGKINRVTSAVVPFVPRGMLLSAASRIMKP